jgi:hypothetical protein
LVLIKRDHAADCLGEYENWGESWAFYPEQCKSTPE